MTFMKGNLVKTPYSEITATLELLASFGVESEHLEALRKALPWKQAITAEVIQGQPFLMSLLAIEDYAKKVGFREADFASIAGDTDKLGRILSYIRGCSEIKPIEHLIDFDKAPSVPKGWTILPDAKQLPNRVRGTMKFDSKKVALHLDDGQKDGKWIQGNKLRQKLEKVPVYGAQLGDFYMANLHLIPEEWKGKAVFFWGTIYRDAGGRLCVRFLYWRGDGWVWVYRWLDVDFNGRSPAAVSAS